MPIVFINVMEGRPPEKIEKMITLVSEAISTSLEAPIESVRIVVNEVQPHQHGIGGKSWRVVQEERRRVRKENT